MNLPKLALLDRDGVLNFASKDPSSPLYYILSSEHLILKPGAREAVQLLKTHGIPMILVTKQRCVGKGLITQEQVATIHDCLEAMLGIEFDGICVETSVENKSALYHAILSNYPVKPNEVVLFDDSIHERDIAASTWIPSYDGANLLESVKHLLSIP